MVKTKKKMRRAAKTTWSANALLKALDKASKGNAVAALKRRGILTKKGKLASKFRSWGNKASRTPDAREMGIAAV